MTEKVKIGGIVVVDNSPSQGNLLLLEKGIKKKEDLKNVIENWVHLDILIYSPTIEAGVNFDKVHY